MTDIHLMTSQQASNIKFVLSDIDDTMTTEGFLEADAYYALWQMRQKGLVVIPVTGRPAGWCDMIIRQWPVDAVIGENGAFALIRTDGKPEFFEHPAVNPDGITSCKKNILDELKTEIPLARIALDQGYRKYDLAIDFAEDEPKLGLDDALRIKHICEKHGAVAKISSIHVNAWFGDYDKVSMVSLCLSRYYSIDLTNPEDNRKCFFLGDSPNDEPMFKALENTCAVGDFSRFESFVKHMPRFNSPCTGSRGFSEAVQVLLT